MRALFFAFPLLACFACRSQPSPDTVPQKEQATSSVSAPAPGWQRYGAALAPAAAVKLGSVLGEPDRYKDKTVTVEGNVRRACSRRGCWMEIADASDPTAPGCRVTFKDYGFFVPTDSAGSQARVQGVVAVETVAAAYVQHLEEEGARFSGKSADGTAREVRLIASGVELRKP
jgi:hypothetical protein